MSSLSSVAVQGEHDLVIARRRTRDISYLLGFDSLEQARFATAVSEIARNALAHGGGGIVDFLVETDRVPQALVARIRDRGPGLTADHPESGIGMGMSAARRMVDDMQVESSPRGTTISLRKHFPRDWPILSRERLAQIVGELAHQPPRNVLEDIQQQNQELLHALEELRRRQEDLARVNRELQDTNRGVVALYAELEDHAELLKRASETKSRFLSYISHEFRTPLNSIRSLGGLLLNRLDGDLTPEQERQVRFIVKATEDLSELVNDLLDLAKVEAGKVDLRSCECRVDQVFGALRGMIRPLLGSESVRFVIDDEQAATIPPLWTDENRLSQILRNLVSNALKFTERGEVRLSASVNDKGNGVVFSIADTGIGIAPEDQERIFQEFVQIENPLQKRAKGTGLGLPLSRKLAELLGGSIWLESRPSQGTTFFVRIPLVHPMEKAAAEDTLELPVLDPERAPTLLIADPAGEPVCEKLLDDSEFQCIVARSPREARRFLRAVPPAAVVVDLLRWDDETWALLAEMRANIASRKIPILVVTSLESGDEATAGDAFCDRPVQGCQLIEKLNLITGRMAAGRILVVEDDEISGVVLQESLAAQGFVVSEAGSIPGGPEHAQEEKPDLILLDLRISGFELLDDLRFDPSTRDIPVVITHPGSLGEQERKRLAQEATAVLLKKPPSRQEIVQVIRQVLQKKASASGA